MLLQNLLKNSGTVPKFLKCDVLVVGGGSGGLACAQAAAKRGASVVICDYVSPSETKKSTWGFGGTCINVGCVPKKLFHRSGFFGHAILDGEMENFGFNTGNLRVDWSKVVSSVQDHIKMLNFTYRNALPDNCTYLNGKARFDSTEARRMVVEYPQNKLKDPSSTVIEAKKAIVLAVGGRPIVPESVPGAKDFAITSDDLFSLKTEPGKTLVVGSSYIGLETASFLNAMGFDTTLLVRSRPLRGIAFDEQCASNLLELMKSSGVKVKSGAELASLSKESNEGPISTSFSDGSKDHFKTVVLATGRRPESRHLNLPENIKLTRDGKINVDPKTFLASNSILNGPSVYAIGDCASTMSPELTPVAIRQGEIVASLVTGEDEAKLSKRLKSLEFVPSTVFTLPSEYSLIGLSEERANIVYGEDDVEVYLKEWQPLEASAAHVRARDGTDGAFRGFAKLITIKSQKDKVVGLHLISPYSSESIHALALACRLGATKDDFDSAVLGVHPTDGEALTEMTVTRASGADFRVAAGCGGGKCG